MKSQTCFAFLLTLSIHVCYSQQHICGTSERRAWRDMTCEEQDRFLSALRQLKASGIHDEFVAVHIKSALQTHGTPTFLPWHRWYIYQYEKALQNITQECIYLPYWDSERDSTDQKKTSVLRSETFGSFDSINQNGCCTDGIAAEFSETVLGGCLSRKFNSDVLISSEPGILNIITNFAQYGNTASGTGRYNGFRIAIGGTPHAGPHNFIGGHMATHLSPEDPLFFLHHANIDRIWAIWQDYRGHDSATMFSVPEHYEGSNSDITTAMRFDGVSNLWHFKLDTGKFPSPNDVLSNDNLVKVKYVNDYLSKLLLQSDSTYDNNKSWIDIATGDVSIRCDRARGIPSSSISPAESFPRQTSNPEDYDGCGTLPRNLCIHPCRWTRSRCQPMGRLLRRPAMLPILAKDCPSVNFTSPQANARWKEICLEMPTATAAKRLAALAESECKARGNTTSVSHAWIQKMTMVSYPAAFSCFQSPDE